MRVIIENLDTNKTILNVVKPKFASFKAFEDKYVIIEQKFEEDEPYGCIIYTSTKDVSKLKDSTIEKEIEDEEIRQISETDLNEKVIKIRNPKIENNFLRVKITITPDEEISKVVSPKKKIVTSPIKKASSPVSKTKINEEDTDPNKDITTYDLDTDEDDIDWTEKWRFPVLHKDNINGRDTLWYMGFDPETNSWFSGDGIVGMKIKTFSDEIIPKAGRTMKQQALQEIRQGYNIKIRNKGYIVPGEEEAELINTMQGPPIDLNKDKLDYPVGVEPKLNGERCLAVLIRGEVIMYSRSKVEWVPERKKFFVKDIELLLSFLPRGVTLDGEMYGADLSRQIINSIIKDPIKYKNKEEINKICINLFTYADTKTPAEERYKILTKAYEKYLANGGNKNRIKIVPMVTVKNKEELIKQHMKNKKDGYEGSVIYKFANGATESSKKPEEKHRYETSLYESGKRTGKNAHVFKLKVDVNEEGQEELLEEEGLIIDYDKGKGSQKDAIIFVVIDPRGNQFRVGSYQGMTIPERQKLYYKAEKKRSAVIGKYLEYKYDELSDDNVPQHAVGLNLRDPDDVDAKVIKQFEKLIKKLGIELDYGEEGSESEGEKEEKKKISSPKKEKKKASPKKEESNEIDPDRLNSDTKSKDNPNPYTLVELKQFAKELGIEKYSRMNKADLVEVIREKLDL